MVPTARNGVQQLLGLRVLPFNGESQHHGREHDVLALSAGSREPGSGSNKFFEQGSA